MVLKGDMVPAGTGLVTTVLEYPFIFSVFNLKLKHHESTRSDIHSNEPTPVLMLLFNANGNIINSS